MFRGCFCCFYKQAATKATTPTSAASEPTALVLAAAPGETGADGDGVLDWLGAEADGVGVETKVPLETGSVAIGIAVLVGTTSVIEDSLEVGIGTMTGMVVEVPTGTLTVVEVGTGTEMTAVEVEVVGTGTTMTTELDGIMLGSG